MSIEAEDRLEQSFASLARTLLGEGNEIRRVVKELRAENERLRLEVQTLTNQLKTAKPATGEQPTDYLCGCGFFHTVGMRCGPF